MVKGPKPSIEYRQALIFGRQPQVARVIQLDFADGNGLWIVHCAIGKVGKIARPIPAI